MAKKSEKPQSLQIFVHFAQFADLENPYMVPSIGCFVLIVEITSCFTNNYLITSDGQKIQKNHNFNKFLFIFALFAPL